MAEMIEMDAYRGADGQIRWNEYEKAKTANGERCTQCQCFVYPPKGHPTKCVSCETIGNQPGEVSHEKLIRCPKCQDTFSPGDREAYELYSDGTHEVTCGECDHEFQVRTWVSYSFDSPALIQEPEEEEETDDDSNP